MMMSDGNAAARSELQPRNELLTVVIPHYNQREFLPRAVASVLHSENCDPEIIIVDDGSTDGSELVLAALEAASPRITVIRCKVNQGVAAALNIGLAAARGRYITFPGADDLVLPNLYRPLLRALGDHPRAGLACSQLAIVGTDGAIRGVRPITPPSFRTEYLDPQTICRRVRKTDHWISGTTAIFHTNLLRAAGGFDATIGVFCDVIVARIIAFQNGFVYVPGIRAIFRVAATTLSGATLLDREKNIRQLADAHDRLANSIVGQIAPDYPNLFVRRLQFSAARLQLVRHGRNADPAVIAAVAGGTDTDVRALTAIRQIAGFGRAGQILAMAWLAFRRWPFSPLHLMVHLMRNRSVLDLNNRQYVTHWMHRMDEAGKAMTTAAGASDKPADVSGR
jgi:glycosyltransferase involved in cell wall biosynthesis